MEATDAAMVPTRAELMERVETAWAELDSALSDLDAHQLSAEPTAGRWPIKDHLAHLAVRIQSAAAIVAGQSRPAAMGIDPDLWAHGDEDEINAAIEDQWSNRSAVEVVDALRTAQSHLRGLIGGISDEDLALPYSHFQANSLPNNPDPVVGWIAGNTFGHVDFHLPTILEIRHQVT